MRIFFSVFISLVLSGTVSLASDACPRGFVPVVSEYSKNRPHTRVQHHNSKNQNYSVCWGVFAPVDTIACYHYQTRPCVSRQAVAICENRDKSRQLRCQALSANKDYDVDELEECRETWGDRGDCMEERGRPLD